jgi:hypothetical protein
LELEYVEKSRLEMFALSKAGKISEDTGNILFATFSLEHAKNKSN